MFPPAVRTRPSSQPITMWAGGSHQGPVRCPETTGGGLQRLPGDKQGKAAQPSGLLSPELCSAFISMALTNRKHTEPRGRSGRMGGGGPNNRVSGS